jgi:hypothetical protein
MSSKLAAIESRGRAMAAFCRRVRERGAVALVEENEDLPRLRAEWRKLRRGGTVIVTLSDLGPTPVDLGRVELLRQQVRARERRDSLRLRSRFFGGPA